MLHFIDELTIDTCDIHQVKENAEVEPKRWLSIQTICGNALFHKINSTHVTIVKLDNLRARNRRLGLWTLFLSSELIICHSFLQGQMIKAALANYSSICKPFFYLKKGTCNLPFHLLIVDHFWHLVSVGWNCSNTINVFLE